MIIAPFTTRTEINNSLESLVVNSHALFSKDSLNDFYQLLLQVMQFRSNIYFLGLIPFLTMTNYALHRKSKFNITEILILHTYFCGQVAFAALVISVFGRLLPLVAFVGLSVIDVVLLQAIYLYLFVRMQKEFFQETWRKAIVMGTAINVLASFFYWIFIFVLFGIGKFVW